MRISDWSSDVCSSDLVIAGTEEKFGGVDILVNNAAILAYGTIETTSLELWQKIQKINSDGYFLGCHYGLEAMKKRPNGSIVNMSSMAGIGGQSSFCAYSRSEEHTSELQSLMRISSAVFCLKKKTNETDIILIIVTN